MYIAVAAIQSNYNPGAYYLTFTVVSSGGTNTTAEVLVDDGATAAQINSAVAEAAREACRANNEDIDTEAPVMLFSSTVQVI